MRTALQSLILSLENQAMIYHKGSASEKNKEKKRVLEALCSAFTGAAIQAKNKLKIEQKQIEDAFELGGVQEFVKERLDYDPNEHAYNNAREFFNYKYKQ